MHITSTDPDEQHIVNYVPDEISVVVSAIGIDDEASFYEHVRTQLNQQIAALLKSTSPYATDPLEADLAPTVLAQRFANDRAVLQPLRRPRGRRRQSDEYEEEPPDLTPWTVFRRHASGAATRHLYFGSAAIRGWLSTARISSSYRSGCRASASSPSCSTGLR